MLARLSRELPEGDYIYEPKWDGFRCLVYREGDAIDMWSRHGRPFSRYFPELVEAFAALDEKRFAVDGEILVTSHGTPSFESLLLRLHPARSRVERLRIETPACFVAFDLLRVGDDDLTMRPFAERRSSLSALLADASGPIRVTDATVDIDLARRWLTQPRRSGIDGVIAKPRTLPYEPGRRAMIKVKAERTADLVVAGLRVFEDGSVASLLLGAYDGVLLRHVGVTSSFTAAVRRRLSAELMPLATDLRGHPWEHGYGLEGTPIGRLAGSAARWTPALGLDWVPLHPARVCEVTYTQADNGRLRYPATFKRWRPDREPQSCSIDQLRE
jgi:ATP-dependent DNA ligase